MPKYDKLPHEVQQAIESYGPSHRLDDFLHEWREDIEARNWLNNWALSEQDQLFVEFHNQYRRERNMI
jgi:hypothetical protein